MNVGGKVRDRDLSAAQNRLELCGAASGNVGDDGGEIIVGARTKRAETLQPSIDGGDDGTSGSRHENLEKVGGVETRSTRGGSDGNYCVLALGRNAAVGNRMVSALLVATLRMANLFPASTPATAETIRSERAKNIAEGCGLRGGSKCESRSCREEVG